MDSLSVNSAAVSLAIPAPSPANGAVANSRAINFAPATPPFATAPIPANGKVDPIYSPAFLEFLPSIVSYSVPIQPIRLSHFLLKSLDRNIASGGNRETFDPSGDSIDHSASIAALTVSSRAL